MNAYYCPNCFKKNLSNSVPDKCSHCNKNFSIAVDISDSASTYTPAPVRKTNTKPTRQQYKAEEEYQELPQIDSLAASVNVGRASYSAEELIGTSKTVNKINRPRQKLSNKQFLEQFAKEAGSSKYKTESKEIGGDSSVGDIED